MIKIKKNMITFSTELVQSSYTAHDMDRRSLHCTYTTIVEGQNREGDSVFVLLFFSEGVHCCCWIDTRQFKSEDGLVLFFVVIICSFVGLVV